MDLALAIHQVDEEKLKLAFGSTLAPINTEDDNNFDRRPSVVSEAASMPNKDEDNTNLKEFFVHLWHFHLYCCRGLLLSQLFLRL